MNSTRYTILFNTNVVHRKEQFMTKLPLHLHKLFTLCAERKYLVVIPETVLLESKRNHQELVEPEQNRLRKAYETLDHFGISFSRVDPTEAVMLPDLPELIRQLGVDVRVEKPTHNDLKEAHDRACLHAPPHPRNTDKDEMRDLVIWMIALRIARADRKNVLLISNEEIHYGTLGDDEARANGLVRHRKVDEALEFLNVRAPAGELLLKMLEPIWGDIRGTQEVELPESVLDAVTEIAHPSFIQGKKWPERATARLTMRTADNRQQLTCQINIVATDDVITDVHLTDMNLEDKPLPDVSVTLQTRLPSQPDDVQEQRQ